MAATASIDAIEWLRKQVEGAPDGLSAMLTENGYGVLDMGPFGPKEPSGFWRPFRAWRKPRFDEVASNIERDTRNADVTLR